MSSYRLIASPTRIPAAGGKTIDEIMGRASTGHESMSVARMVAPAGWEEEAQTPEFGELTLMLRGRLSVELVGETISLMQGQALWVEPGVRVRYHNPHGEEAEYFAICMPAFSTHTAHREEPLS